MITPADDLPLHQSARPFRDPGPERNLYDRFFFNGYSPDGEVFFAAALGLYPGRNIMDAAFACIVDGVQHNVRASRLMGQDRLDTRVGPVAVSVDERLRRLTITVDDRESGVSAHLVFTARTPMFEEDRYTWQPGYREIFDYTRLTQSGAYSGSITVPGHGPIVVGEGWWGTRDRSWGIRPVGEREAGAPEFPRGFYWLWAPLNFADGASLFDINENPDGSRWHHEAMWAPVGDLDGPVERGEAVYAMEYKPGTRHAASARLELELPSGIRKVELTPLYNFTMQGLGYTHPVWGHGMYVGDDLRTYESFVVAEVDETAPFNQHVQALCRAERDDGVTGLGVFEQLIIGPHEPSGLRDLLDMHD